MVEVVRVAAKAGTAAGAVVGKAAGAVVGKAATGVAFQRAETRLSIWRLEHSLASVRSFIVPVGKTYSAKRSK